MARSNATRNASIIRYTLDFTNSNGQKLSKAYFGLVYQLFSINIIGVQQSFAFIRQYPVYSDGPLLIRAKHRGKGERLEMIRLAAIQQLAAIIKSNGKEAFALKYTSIFH